MINCTSLVLNGLDISCADSIGGIKEVYIALRDKVTQITVDGENEGMIQAITMANTEKFKTYKFRKQTGSLTSTVTTDDAAGTSYVSSVLALQFTKADQAKRLEIQSLIFANVYVIVKDQNGTNFLLGLDNPVTCTAATHASGQAVGDFNGYTIELTDLSRQMPYIVPDSVLETVV